MKRFRHLYLIALTTWLALAGCSQDAGEWDDRNDNQQGAPDEELVELKVRIRPAGASFPKTRAWTDSPNARDEEMMNIWTVVVCEMDGKVVAAHACRPAPTNSGDSGREEDDIFRLKKGNYCFYSFANIDPATILDLLGIGKSAPAPTRAERAADGSITNYGDPFGEENEYPNDNLSQNGSEGTGQGAGMIGNSVGTIYDLADYIRTGADVNANDVMNVAVGISAKGFDPGNVGTMPNCFGEIGIPMSNVQQFEVTDDDNKDLIVVRAYAKIELRVFNETGKPVTISDVKLSDITRSISGNYRLLPSMTSGWDNMEPVHGDIQPNLNLPDSKGVFHYATTTSVPADNTVASETYQTITFYVNESAEPLNHFGRFYLGLSLSVDGNPVEYRYALIDDANGTGKTGSWAYIARNDYRIIPVVLDDYQLDIIPYDFPGIGLTPASVKEEDGQFTINFHDYGHFHLVPVVRQLSTGGVLPFVSTAPTTGTDMSWGLVADDWSQSWMTYDKYGGTLQDTGNYDGFYKDVMPSPAKDISEGGGIPVLDTTTQWNGCNEAPSKTPFIFGYIENPGAKLTSDKTIYHEFKIQLYNGTTPFRQKTYRLYMILDTKQLVYKE